MKEKYDFQKIENKWQEFWYSQELFNSDIRSDKKKYYVLEMFPYPSGEPHIGHVKNYVIGDVVARYKHSRGFNILHPMGWDSFGLPAENAAIKNQIHPAKWTQDNIKKMKDSIDGVYNLEDFPEFMDGCEYYSLGHLWGYGRMLKAEYLIEDSKRIYKKIVG